MTRIHHLSCHTRKKAAVVVTVQLIHQWWQSIKNPATLPTARKQLMFPLLCRHPTLRPLPRHRPCELEMFLLQSFTLGKSESHKAPNSARHVSERSQNGTECRSEFQNSPYRRFNSNRQIPLSLDQETMMSQTALQPLYPQKNQVQHNEFSATTTV